VIRRGSVYAGSPHIHCLSPVTERHPPPPRFRQGSSGYDTSHDTTPGAPRPRRAEDLVNCVRDGGGSPAAAPLARGFRAKKNKNKIGARSPVCATCQFLRLTPKFAVRERKLPGFVHCLRRTNGANLREGLFTTIDGESTMRGESRNALRRIFDDAADCLTGKVVESSC
jgi:hypothetical protein